MRVTGRLDDSNGTQIGDCTLELRAASDDMLIDSEKVGNAFNVSFVIAPNLQEYILVVSCPESGLSRRFGPYAISGTSHYRTPLNLGTIVLQKR